MTDLMTNKNRTDEIELAEAAAANAFGLEAARSGTVAPERLKAKLRKDADRFFGHSRRNQWNWGWAAAAALALVFVATTLIDIEPTIDYESARENLLAEGSDAVLLQWATPEDPEYARVTGDVVWSDARQEGYMLLSGMPVNDPDTSQYQLWLVDPERDSNPVDGGVFDIPAGEGAVIIPIAAKLAVDDPVAFAITREKPGGVVVSRGPLLVVASSG